MPKAIAQFTIYDFHDVQSSTTAPTNPVLNMIWLDTSVTPPIMRVYNGTAWVAANDFIVGGRNLMTNSKSTDAFTAFTGGTNITMFYRTVTLSPDIKAGDKITVSLTYKYTNIVLVTGQEANAKIYIQGSGNVTGWSPGFGGGPNIVSNITKGNSSELKYYQSYTFTLSASQVTNQTFSVGIRTDYIASGSLSIYEMKVEKGDKPTGWTQAPEDIDSITTSHTTQINAHQGQIDTLIQDTTIVKDGQNLKLKDEYSKLVQDVAGFKTTVGTTYSSKTEVADTVSAAITTVQTDLQTQIDGKIETFSQSTDPSPAWTTTILKTQHTGDIWYNSTTKLTYRWSGTAWVKLEDADATTAQTLAQTKKRVFTATPIIPYDVGDLWVTDLASTGDIKICITARATGNYIAVDWVKASKYTDDTTVSSFINNTYTPALTTMQNTLDSKATSYYQTTSPHTEYTAVADNATYNVWVGDLWYNSTSTVKKTYIYTKTVNGTAYNYAWLQQEIPVDIFNTISGKKTIYTAKPTSYAVNDLWILESNTAHTVGTTGQILTAINTSTTYSAAHWVKKVTYTDDTYAKGVESTLTQTATDLTAKFSNSGGNNLIRDSLVKETSSIYGFGVRSVDTSLMVEGITYTLTFRGRTVNNIGSKYLNVFIYTPDWSFTKDVPITETTLTTKSVTFVATASMISKGLSVTAYHYPSSGDRTGSSYLDWYCLTEGEASTVWISHHSEVYDGITKIDANGVQVSHSNVLSKTKMSAEGFSIVDENDEVLAWLSNKKQWTELNVDKVYAGNILNVYQGPETLYVNHSFTGSSDGTSTKPFSSFSDLQSYLGATPIINKDLTINIQNPGYEITEQFCLNSLFGAGYIQIIYDANITHRARGNGAFAARFYQIPKYILLSGGRSAYNSTNGALITDDGYGHGVWASDIGCLYIGYITINCKNWGLVCERTRCYNLAVDFGKCYNAVELRDMSIYYMYDCSGGNTDFCRVKSGSIAYWGDDGNGIRPNGNVIASKGAYYSYGAGRTATDSYRFPTASPAPTVPTTSNYSQSFSWTSHTTYQYQWSNWGDSECKQGSWGYGLRGGHMFFDIASIKSFLSGTVQDGNTITLTRASSGGLSGASNVYINGSTCGGASGTPGYSNQTWLGTLAWGETKTFTLPKTIVSTLKAGTCSSLAVYVNSTAQSDYINIVNASITLKVNK